jgi:hypothetical protein
LNINIQKKEGGHMSSLMQKPYIGQTCYHCKIGSFQVPSNGQEWHLDCTECNAVLFCYNPMPHQAKFHQDPSKFKAFFGGY